MGRAVRGNAESNRELAEWWGNRKMKAYQLIEPDGTEGGVYLGEQGRIYVMRFCRHNPGWTWREIDSADL